MKKVMTLVVAFAFMSCSQDDEIQNEGTISNPKLITIGKPHNGEIKGFGSSYYKFVVSTSDSYSFDLMNLESDLGMFLYSDESFENEIDEGGDDYDDNSDEYMSSTLEPGTYYLLVEEYDHKSGHFVLLIDHNLD